MFGQVFKKYGTGIAMTTGILVATSGLNTGFRFSDHWKGGPVPGAQAATAAASKPHGGMDPKEFVPMRVKAVDGYNYNTRVYHFELDTPNSSVEAPLTSYVLTRYNDGEKDVVRPYTPIHTHKKGQLSLLVKSYPTGKMSQKFASLKPGDVLDVKGPCVKFKYEANRNPEALLICGGTGITPMLQLAEGILANSNDKTKVKVIFANATEQDILLKEELDNLAKAHPKQFEIVYTLDKAPSGWMGHAGFLTKDVVAKHAPSKNGMVYVCGPPGMMDAVSGPKGPNYTQGEVGGILKDLGFTKDNVFKF